MQGQCASTGGETCATEDRSAILPHTLLLPAPFCLLLSFCFFLGFHFSYVAIVLRVLNYSTYVVRLGSYFLHGVVVALPGSRESIVVE